MCTSMVLAGVLTSRVVQGRAATQVNASNQKACSLTGLCDAYNPFKGLRNREVVRAGQGLLVHLWKACA